MFSFLCCGIYFHTQDLFFCIEISEKKARNIKINNDCFVYSSSFILTAEKVREGRRPISYFLFTRIVMIIMIDTRFFEIVNALPSLFRFG